LRHIDFDPDSLSNREKYTDRNDRKWDVKDWWLAWYARAENAKRAILEAADSGEKLKFDSTIWSDLKHFMLKKVFHGKCAYCESKFEAVEPGEADHYRPKGEIYGKYNGEFRKVMNGAIPHPGYYWLAYEWSNLLPACSLCNGPGGKMSKFPIDGRYALSPKDGEDLATLGALEEPLLLNPYKDDPSKDIQFGEFGIVTPKGGSKYGDTSIQVYDLNREALLECRREAQKRALREFAIAVYLNDKKVVDVLEEYRNGTKEYSVASEAYIALKHNLYNTDLQPGYTVSNER
jgi:hypothetical protein